MNTIENNHKGKRIPTRQGIEYIATLIDRQTQEPREVKLLESAIGFTWIDQDGNDLENIDPQPRFILARRELERKYLYTHEIYWPLAQPRSRKEKNDISFCLHLPPSLAWELRLIAGLLGKTPGAAIRDMLQNYIRPGTLPPLDQAFLDKIIADYARKCKTP